MSRNPLNSYRSQDESDEEESSKSTESGDVTEDEIESELESDKEVFALTAEMQKWGLPIVEGDENHYQLNRTGSAMSNYSELLEDILNEQGIGEIDFNGDAHQYSQLAVIIPDAQKIAATKKLEEFKSGYEGARNKPSAKSKAKYPERKTKEAQEYQARKKELEGKIKERADLEINYSKELEAKQTHLFRGKNLTSTFVDPVTKKSRMRSRKEILDYVTRKFAGKPILSDGLFEIENDDARKVEVRQAVREYFRAIKSQESNTALFNSGKAYTKAIEKLSQATKLANNPVVATTKFPWVASEYGVGQMGGASGGGRGTDLGSKDQHRPLGYDSSKRPVNRVLANAFVVSLPMKDYHDLRQSNDLIDVNADVRKGTEPNRVIEEVTFNSMIDGKYVSGSFPLVLPRLDRDYDQMSAEKKAQYKKIFGLDETKYKKLQASITDAGVKIGDITEHLIQHHGSLLRAIAIKKDRAAGYVGDFVVPYNQSYQGHTQSMTTPTGGILSTRDARIGSASKSSGHVEDSGEMRSQIARIRNDGACYADDEMNAILESHLPANVSYINAAVALVEVSLAQSIAEFKDDANKHQALILMHGHNHFTALHITKKDNGNYEIIYFDPTVDNQSHEPLHPLSPEISKIIKSSFVGNKIIDVRNTIQTSSIINGDCVIDNLHCGPFVAYFMIEMAHGNIAVNCDQQLVVVDHNGEMGEGIQHLIKTKSDQLGKAIRSYHLNYLQGLVKSQEHSEVLKNFLQDQESLYEQEREDEDFLARRLHFNDSQSEESTENSTGLEGGLSQFSLEYDSSEFEEEVEGEEVEENEEGQSSPSPTPSNHSVQGMINSPALSRSSSSSS